MIMSTNAARLAVAAASLAFASPALSAETLTAVFTTPDGGQTVGLYSGIVNVTVRGTGFSLGSQINDAFYLVASQTHNPSFYQLTFGTAPLVALNPAQNAVNFIVGGLPAYQASHVYSFQLNTLTAVPSILHFGVGDGQFGDNGGQFVITVSGMVPEPATWALLILGFGVVGGAMRHARRRVAALSYA